ncbi:MAG: hypothetical protein U9R14_00705 [Patescibacteria group bacterium]|nr:hypothetical protein [Patescibacteria group bacterium]
MINIFIKAVILAVLLAVVFVCAGNRVNAAVNIDASIKQVKTINNSTVYYLDHNAGMKKAYNNEAAYLSYGNEWSNVQIVSMEELDQWTNIHLIKTSASPAVYYINGDKKALIINEREFINNGFDWNDIVIVNEIDLMSYVLSDFDSIFSQTYDSGEIAAKLSESSPAGYFVSLNTKNNLAAVFNFKANKSAVEITNLSFKLKGVFDNEVIEKIYLTDENEEGWEFIASISNKTANFNLSANPLVVSSGQEKEISIFMDLGYCDNVVNQTFWVSLEEAEYINTEAEIAGDFPIESNSMELIDGTNVLAQVEAEQQTVVPEGAEAIIGNTDKLLTKYKISETSNNENILIKELIFINLGAAGNFEINNFELRNDNNETIAQVNKMDGNEIKFKFDDYGINKGNYDYFTVYGDIISGEDKTIKLQLNEIKVLGENLGFSLPAEIINTGEIITIKREMLGVMAIKLESNDKVFTEQTGTIIGLFEVRSDNQNVVLDSMEISLTRSGSAPGLAETVFLINYDTGETISSINGDNLDSGSVVLGLNNIELEAKDELSLALVTEIPADAEDGDVYKITLNKITYQTENRIYYSDEINVGGKTLTVSRSNLYIYDNDEIGESLYIKGQEKIKIASFIFESAANEDVKINSVTLIKGDTSGSVTYDNGFSNMKLYIGSSKKGRTIEKPYSDSWSFDGFNYKLRSGKRVEVKIYIDIDKDLKISETQLAIADLAAFGYNSNIKTGISGLNTNSYKTVFGKAEAEIFSTAGGSVLAGEDNNCVASFTIKNSGDENLKLKYLTINTSNDGFSYSLGYSNLEIVESGSAKRVGRKISKPVAGANKIRLRNYKVEAGEEIVFDVYVDANESVPTGSFQAYFSVLEAEGEISDVEAEISGQPTDNVTVTVN